jgi:mRNA interferase RelE/StbE
MTSTSYELKFKEPALEEFKKLDPALRRQFQKKLAERLQNPHVPSAQLRDMPGCYKIKLHSAGYRLVYQVRDSALVIVVIAVGRRDRKQVYKAALARLEGE